MSQEYSKKKDNEKVERFQYKDPRVAVKGQFETCNIKPNGNQIPQKRGDTKKEKETTNKPIL